MLKLVAKIRNIWGFILSEPIQIGFSNRKANTFEGSALDGHS